MPSSTTHPLSLPDALPIYPQLLARPRRHPGREPAPARASDGLGEVANGAGHQCRRQPLRARTACPPARYREPARAPRRGHCPLDRKSTRLNSSHVKISYAVLHYPPSFPTRRSSDLSTTSRSSTTTSRTRARSGAGVRRSGRGGERRRPSMSATASSRSDSLPSCTIPRARPSSSSRPLPARSEEHTSELQSRENLVCRPPLPTLFPYPTLFRSIHNFSLVHDDIQDESPLRRGRPTVWARWRTAQAINVGDSLFALGQLALLHDTASPPELLVEATAR